jgi:tetratricopeptide (TPR) repeat protein
MPLDRLGLIQQLNGLSLVQFNAVVFALQPPAGLMPPPSASQGERVFALLSWAEGTGGCGLERLQEVFQTVLTNPNQPSSTSLEQSQTPGTGSVNVGGDASGSFIVTGSGNKIVIGTENPPSSEGSAQNRHNLPRSGAAKFVGRETELDILHEKLQQSGRLNIAAIKGMGGIGKSELALQYAYRHLDLGTYPGGLCWLDLRSGDISGEIVRFARKYLKLDIPDGLDLDTQLVDCWRDWPGKPGEVLVIYDNAGEYGEVKPFLPPADPRFRVLITSRNRMGSPVETLEILILEEGAALELLGVLAGKERVENQLGAAKELCRRLGYLPLAIELVGRYLAADPDLSISQMLRRLEEKGLSTKALAETEQGMTAKLGVKAAFELSWQELDEKGQELGYVLSLFAEGSIPWKLVEECLPELDTEELESVRNKQLSGLSLLERLEQGVYQLHPLIREYFGQKQEQFAGVDALKRRYCRVMVSQAQEFPQTPTQMQLEEFAPVVPHLAEVADRLLEWVEVKELIWIFIGLGRYFKGQGVYSQAKQWYQRCVEECRRRLGDEHLDTLTSLSNLAATLSDQGDYGGARQLQEHVLKVRRRVLGEEHPDTLRSMNNLAYTLSAQGDYGGACKLQEQVLVVSRRVLGEEHPDTLRSMNNLASTLKSQGNYGGVHQLQEQVLVASCRVLGEEHPDTLSSMNNLANTLYDLGDYSGARQLQEQVLEVRRRVLGEEHLDTLSSVNNLASTLSSQADYAEARSLQEQVLKGYRRVLGEEHPDTLSSMNNLANTLSCLGDYSGACQLQEQVLEVRRRVLGEEHPSTFRTMGNIASVLSSQGDYSGARSLEEQVLVLSQRVLGEEHPSTLRAMGNLASTLYFQGDNARARQLQEQVYEVSHRVLGDEHPDTLKSMNNLASTLHSQGDYEQAELLYVQVVVTCINVLGQRHPTTATFLQNYLGFLSDIVQNHPDVLARLLADGSAITKQILEQMQKDKELGNLTQEG